MEHETRNTSTTSSMSPEDVRTYAQVTGPAKVQVIPSNT